MKQTLVNSLAGVGLLTPTLLFANLVGEGPRLAPEDRITQGQIVEGELTLDEIRQAGMLIFSTPFNRYDGYGDGPHDESQPDNHSPDAGNRPTLQGNGTFLRVNGLDSQNCLECHSIVSNRTVPPTMGIGGGGGFSTSAMLRPVNIDVIDESFDGTAEYDGRLINPLFLFGTGGIELVAREMTFELQALKQNALDNPGTVVSLDTKSVNFGTIVADEDGNLDTSNVEGVDEDLVVRPFGRKGDVASAREFAMNALSFHMGMQATEKFGGEDADEDNDGVTNEISIGDLSAISIFVTTLDRPFQIESTKNNDGRKLFRQVGCADCHRPVMTTERRRLPYKLTGSPEAPFEDTFYEVDLSKPPTIFKSIFGAGIEVEMFSDLKRHDMGIALSETAFFQDEVQNREFITARLWGVADTAPYMHDGRALTLVEAILLHDNPGSDAGYAAENFQNLSDEDKNKILYFLMSLRMPKDPVSDLNNR
ncbi:di-heme oxidoredictase family protein [Microbulbifer variabilis]|uniref:di-heme oxidoredictase family protein n=1 Tax=Microbulbifer variabilis TaxID=266805 RepID=UPI001CFF5023|nr:di-heme oxidoredictase family protein [Microbulbifer variabilis]